MQVVGILKKITFGKIKTLLEVIFMEMEELTRFEQARLLGARAIQISMGAKPKVELGDSLHKITKNKYCKHDGNQE